MIPDPFAHRIRSHAIRLLEAFDKQCSTGLVLVVKFAGHGNNCGSALGMIPIEILQPNYLRKGLSNSFPFSVHLLIVQALNECPAVV
ncbi:hypothetical protein FFY45_05685 [Xanthomonas hortorum]|nr:hypothetical protein [Xanthomonas hortorum]